MKLFLLSAAFTLISLAAFAQYGKLQPVKAGDTTMIIRTPASVLEKLSADKSSTVRRDATLIEQIEEALEARRKYYLNGSVKKPYDDGQLKGMIGILQRESLPDAKYYIKEYTLYRPKE